MQSAGYIQSGTALVEAKQADEPLSAASHSRGCLDLGRSPPAPSPRRVPAHARAAPQATGYRPRQGRLRGNFTMKVVRQSPSPRSRGWLCTSVVPPCASTIRLARYRPTPSPRHSPADTPNSNTLPMTESGMPGPSSEMATTRHCAPPSVSTRTSILPEGDVYLTALSTKFWNARRNSRGSTFALQEPSAQCKISR